jgi:hypothetical protein
MDKLKYSRIATTGLEHNNPFDSSIADVLIQKTGFSVGEKAIDFGAGKCFLISRFVQEFGMVGTAVEIDVLLTGDVVRQGLEIVNADASKFYAAIKSPFSLSICFGSVHLLGGFYSAIGKMQKITREGGCVLVADLVWKREPTSEILNILGVDRNVYSSEAQNNRFFEESGLRLIYKQTATEEEWDTFESAFCANIEKYTLQKPNDGDAEWMLQRAKAWKSIYEDYCKDFLKFNLYLLRQ